MFNMKTYGVRFFNGVQTERALLKFATRSGIVLSIYLIISHQTFRNLHLQI
jgi:hypothetical protein